MFFQVIFLTLLSTVLADVCWDAPIGRSRRTLELCPYGCCNEYTRNPCCSLPVGLIVGVIIGIITFITIVVVTIICCVRRRSYTRTQMTYVNGAPQTQVITTSQQSGGVVYGGPQPYYAPQPGGYAPQPGGYAPQAGGYAPQAGGYAPQAGGYAPPAGGYAPQAGGYAPQAGDPQAPPPYDGLPTKN